MTPDDFPNDYDIGSQVADSSPAGISGSPNCIRLKLNVIFLRDKSCGNQASAYFKNVSVHYYF